MITGGCISVQVGSIATKDTMATLLLGNMRKLLQKCVKGTERDRERERGGGGEERRKQNNGNQRNNREEEYREGGGGGEKYRKEEIKQSKGEK